MTKNFSVVEAGGDSKQFGVAGWSELIESLRSLPDQMLAKLPESMRTDPQIQQEVGRLALESLTSVCE